MPDSAGRRLDAITGLLDDGLLTGQHETSTVLRPERCARAVRSDDVEAAVAEIGWACQVWGGGTQPLVPVTGRSVPAAYKRLLVSEQIDAVATHAAPDTHLELPRRVEARHPWDHPAMLVAAAEPAEQWMTVEVVELERDDPWRTAYAGVLGTWPSEPDAQLLERSFLRPELRFDDVFNVERVAVEGSLADLIERAGNRSRMTPRQAANVQLAFGVVPDSSFLGDHQEVLPNPRATRRAAGPNLIVVMTPGSVDDLALLWNLRGAHGARRVMPIGIPAEFVTQAALRELGQPGRVAVFGLGGGVCHLVSASIADTELQRLADLQPPTKAASFESVLTFGPAAGRHRSHVSLWEAGRTRIDPMSDSDREALRESLNVHSPHLVLDVRVDGSPLPADQTMRGAEFYSRFQAGSAQVQVPTFGRNETVGVQWPSGWTALAAVAQTRGVDVKPSEPGLAAATLIRALGSVDNISLLLHRPLIDLAYRMAERSGMSWWRRRWADVHRELVDAGADPTTLDRAASVLGRDDPAVAPAGEGRDVGFQEFVTALGGVSAATHWVTWAERRHLLVRGANVTCPDCKTKSWLPLVALPPPVACPGCGREVDHPYEPRALTFTYRLGEPLRRVLETDSLGHVLALRWFVELFERALVGAHPGVNVVDPGSGRNIGEADVLLLFADGSLVPIEVKRRAAGVDDAAATTLGALSDTLESPWDGFVVTEPGRSVTQLQSFQQHLPDRPRVVLTDDHLHAHHVFWAAGANPFEWSAQTDEEDRQRQKAFTNLLSERDPDSPWDWVAETLLDRSL